jgi:hypothetical protein
MGQTHSIHGDVTAILTEMSIPTASLCHTILLRDRCFVGHKFRFDGGYAMWLAETNTVEIYDDDRKLLKTVTFPSDEKEAAA